MALTTHPQSSAEVKEKAELYSYSPSGPSWPILGLGRSYSRCRRLEVQKSVFPVVAIEVQFPSFTAPRLPALQTAQALLLYTAEEVLILTEFQVAGQEQKLSKTQGKV
jgi:hypothetical protein